jgi:ribonuclease HI
MKTPKAGAPVDITFRCLDRTFAVSVQANSKESELQRIVANVMQMNLDGYWVAAGTEGLGRIGALISGSTVTLTPATTDQIQRVVQARTNATSEPKPGKVKTHEPRKTQQGTASKNWLAIQASREERVDWIKFGQELERDKMVHVITDGGARPNPGAAGWGVLVRQSGKHTENWGHWDMASNNAMELLAVTEALANIPDDMHVWIMTDSAYVKNSITPWVANWVRNGWKNSRGARVANKSLWERLIAAVNRMRRVEWSWVKAHNGRLLNECADMLAMRGVHNEPRPCPVSTIRVSGEDSDHTVYELLDGEETPVVGKEGEEYPLGRTYVLKASSEERPFGVGLSSTQGPTENVEQTIEENLRETLDLSTRDVQESVQVQSQTEPEEEESFPIPEESNESSSPQWETGEAASMKIYRMIKFGMEQME